MTIGEIANLVNVAWTQKKANLTVIKIPGLTRSMTFEETSYPWVLPSPNMPTIDTALVYPGTCLFESVNLSEGRGTTRPFELIGAPFVDADEWVNRLRSLKLPGVSFRQAWFKPSFDDFAGEECAGLQIHITGREKFDPIRTAFEMLQGCYKLHPDRVIISPGASKRVGVENFHERIKTESVESIIASWKPDLEKFMTLRERALLYPKLGDCR